MISPCRSCDNLHGDKNTDACVNCHDRLDYIRYLADPDHFVPAPRPEESGGLQMPEAEKSEKPKVCTKCGKEKPADSDHFYKNPGCKDGLAPECKDCKRERDRKRNRERRAAADKKAQAAKTKALVAKAEAINAKAEAVEASVPDPDQPEEAPANSADAAGGFTGEARGGIRRQVSGSLETHYGAMYGFSGPVEEPLHLTLDFSDRPELLERLADVAGEDFRTPELQALYFIKSQLENMVYTHRMLTKGEMRDGG